METSAGGQKTTLICEATMASTLRRSAPDREPMVAGARWNPGDVEENWIAAGCARGSVRDHTLYPEADDSTLTFITSACRECNNYASS